MTPDPIPHARESASEVLRKVVVSALRFCDRAAGEGVFFLDGGDPSEFLYEAYSDCERPLDDLIGRITAAIADPTPAPSGDDVAELRVAREAGEQFGTNAVQRRLYGDIAEAGARAALARSTQDEGERP